MKECVHARQQRILDVAPEQLQFRHLQEGLAALGINL